MNKREFMFFKDELNLLIEKEKISMSLFESLFKILLIPFFVRDFFKTEKEMKGFIYSVKRLLLKYNLLDKDNKIKVDKSCLDCNRTNWLCSDEIKEASIVKMDVDKLLEDIYKKHQPKIKSNNKDNLKNQRKKINHEVLVPLDATETGKFLADVIANAIEKWNGFIYHARCILLRTAEIELGDKVADEK
ncbi:hypothetical protein [Hippea sp. KM1]|uniref:hypothetical protein n=1 Tax=Hippea sp. KM1 TaxID=944481 RepID=UPI00046D3C76|nr:hypothetical protein [Hippea sp. KM1]